MPDAVWIGLAVAAVLIVLVALVLGLTRYRRRRISLSTRPQTGTLDRSGGYTTSSGITFSQTSSQTISVDESAAPAEPVAEPVPDRVLPEPEFLEPPAPAPAPAPVEEAPAVPPVPSAPPAPAAPEAPLAPTSPEIEEIAPPEGRLERLRGRLARSQNTLGRSMLGLLGGGDLDEDSWQDVEDTLLIADLGPDGHHIGGDPAAQSAGQRHRSHRS